MAEIQTIIKHDGVTYTGQIGTIKRTTLGIEDHGIMSAMLHVEWKGGGIGVGGYTLDGPRKDDDGKRLGRFGSAFGMDHIIRILETVGVEKWEALPGKQVIVLFKDGGGWGSTACGIAGITNENVLDFKKHVALFINEKDN